MSKVVFPRSSRSLAIHSTRKAMVNTKYLCMILILKFYDQLIRWLQESLIKESTIFFNKKKFTAKISKTNLDITLLVSRSENPNHKPFLLKAHIWLVEVDTTISGHFLWADMEGWTNRAWPIQPISGFLKNFQNDNF